MSDQTFLPPQFPEKIYRIFAQVVYKEPKYDEFGFPESLPVTSAGHPDVNILADDIGELAIEVTATTSKLAQQKVTDLPQHPGNSHVLEITITDVVEL